MNIVLLGSGNIATHLGRAFHGLGHRVLQVFSRNQVNATALASLLESSPITALGDMDQTADLYILAVADHAIAHVAQQLPSSLKGIVVHCSGATDISLLSRFTAFGVIYPPQSMHKHSEVRIDQIPFGVEGNDAGTTALLLRLAQTLSSQAFLCDSRQRLALHTAAVFANNFTNALYGISYNILTAHKLSFDLLKPIIVDTALKIQHHLPHEVQTGPAVRGDYETIEKHLQFLSENPLWLKIYQQLTEEITRTKES